MSRDIANHSNRSDWHDRSVYWNSSKTTRARSIGLAKGEKRPLILSGHGMRLRINYGALEAQNGFTHYPQKQEITRIFPGDRDAPSRIVMLGSNGAITLSVLSWLAEQNIPLLQLDYRGNVVAAIGHSGIGHDSALVRLQIAASEATAQNRELGAWLIRKKLLATRETILACLPDNDLRKRADTSITDGLRKLDRPWELPKEALLGVEGKCATLYFDAWRTVPISWKGISRKPIPQSWLSIGVRRGPANHSNRFARHPVQAMLNYGYAVVESLLRIETAKVGLDMTVGFLHQSRYERPALIMDLIEPIRATVDRIVLDMIRANSFSPVDFTISQDGVVRLHPQLGRALVAQIGTPKSIDALISAFLTQIGFKVPELNSGRGQTWMAQRALKRGNAVDRYKS
ncbi:MAG: CRISPR-associated endonuclease Cas1 [Proteobacteria bacterium]|nr:CRISPR-associated endonuclease Cas1 [Pseudomonadota bacterium]